MGLFDNLKPRKSELDVTLQQMLNKFFPKGENDINAGTEELLHILNHKIEKKEARVIFIQSFSLLQISEKFDKERLSAHLAGYCLQHFNDKQVEQFHGYLAFLHLASNMFRKAPSEVTRKGEAYFC